MSSELICRLLKAEVERLKKAVDRQQAALDNDPGQIIMDCHVQFAETLEKYRAGEITADERDYIVKNLNAKNEAAKSRLKAFNLMREMDKLRALKMEYMNADAEHRNAEFSINIRKMKGRDGDEAT